MADHTISLNAVDEIVLLRFTERFNERQRRDDPEYIDLTADQALSAFISRHFAEIRQELQTTTNELFQIANGLTTAQRTALLARLPDGPRKTWLQGRITSGS